MVGPNACTRERGCGVAQMGGGPTSGPGMLVHISQDWATILLSGIAFTYLVVRVVEYK